MLRSTAGRACIIREGVMKKQTKALVSGLVAVPVLGGPSLADEVWVTNMKSGNV